MVLPGFGQPQWVDVTHASGPGAGGGRNEGHQEGRNGQQQAAWARKTEFKWKLEMEKARISRGKKEKNYFLFVNKEGDFAYEDGVIAEDYE